VTTATLSAGFILMAFSFIVFSFLKSGRFEFIAPPGA